MLTFVVPFRVFPNFESPILANSCLGPLRLVRCEQVSKVSSQKMVSLKRWYLKSQLYIISPKSELGSAISCEPTFEKSAELSPPPFMPIFHASRPCLSFKSLFHELHSSLSFMPLFHVSLSSLSLWLHSSVPLEHHQCLPHCTASNMASNMHTFCCTHSVAHILKH